LTDLSVHVLGYAAGVLTTGSCLPQVVKSVRSRSLHDLSLLMLLMLVVGVLFWVIYGFRLHDWPIVASNGVSFALWGAVLYLKLRNPR
jgi:MtN3 and saliva related transmembrane protein